MNLCAILNKIIEQSNINILSSHPVFLSVIQKEFHENYVSRLLAYTIGKDNSLSEKIVRCYHKKNTDFSIKEIQSIECEKTISNQKRIDIFVRLIDNSDNNINIIIENKLLSHEHNLQTQKYSKWLNSFYPQSNNENIFIYLKPSWNASEAVDNCFLSITYNQLLSLIADSTDYIINDFKEYIKMIENNQIQLDETEKLIISNYTTITEALNRVDYKIKKFQSSFQEIIKNELRLTSYVDGGNAYHFYKDEWWSGYSQVPYYYFYVEYKFNSNNLDDIVFQRTVKIGKELESDPLLNFIKDKDIPYTPWKRYLVLDKKPFICDQPILSDAWVAALINQAKNTLVEYENSTEELYEMFKNEILKK